MDLIHDTRHLCTRLRTNGLKKQLYVIFQRANKWKNYRTFHLKDNNGKLWVELIIVASWDAVATVNVLTANNNHLNLVET